MGQLGHYLLADRMGLKSRQRRLHPFAQAAMTGSERTNPRLFMIRSITINDQFQRPEHPGSIEVRFARNSWLRFRRTAERWSVALGDDSLLFGLGCGKQFPIERPEIPAKIRLEHLRHIL
jgi:hypothetical protein